METEGKTKRNDRILILILVVVSAAALIGIRFYQKKTTNRPVAVVVAYGEEIGRYSLDKDLEETIDLGGGEYNTLIIKDGEATVTEASCPDQICVNHQPISNNGEMIICLPHEFIVQIEGGEEASMDAIAN